MYHRVCNLKSFSPKGSTRVPNLVIPKVSIRRIKTVAYGCQSGACGTSKPKSVASPFIGGNNSNESTEKFDVLSIENVNKSLDYIRPVLMNDGGDVEIVKIQNGKVFLRFQGSCSTCTSQEDTMKGGIETTLRSSFGELLKEIIQIDKLQDEANVINIDGHLNLIRNAIAGLGGKVEVISVENGVCKLRYNGPKGVRKGIDGVIRERFTDVKNVVFEDQ